MAIDSVIAKGQSDGGVVAESYAAGVVRDVRFQGKSGIFRHDQLPARKCGKYAVLRIAGRPCRASRTLFSSGPHGAGGALRPLWACDSLWPGLPALTGTARRAGLSSGPHRAGLPAVAGWAGRARFSSGAHRPGFSAAATAAGRAGFFTSLATTGCVGPCTISTTIGGSRLYAAFTAVG